MKYSLSIIFTFIGLIVFICSACAQKPAGGNVESDWIKAGTSVLRGKVEPFTIDDSSYGRKRKIWVYTPAGYADSSTTPADLIVSFDGEDYVKDIPAPVILDNLIAAKKIGPVIQVFVDNSDDRLGDLANHQKFADFVAKDLMPWIRKNYRVTTDPARVVLCGYSAGGLAAAYVAYRHPELFGNVLSESGAFWRGNEGASDDFEWVTRQFGGGPKLKLRFYLVVGCAETVKNASGKSMLETSQHLDEVLLAKAYDVKFVVAPKGTHSPESWRTQVADGLIYLLGIDRR